MSTQAPPDHGDPFVMANREWEPPANEAYLLASFWQGYDSLDTCIVYDSDAHSGEAWVESTRSYRRMDCL